MGIYFCRVDTDDGADTEPASGTTTIIIIILISYTCFSSLRQMMDLSTEAAQATKTTLCTARELQKVERDYSRTWKTGKKHSCFQKAHDTLLVSI
ncbi:unnamed protein product [Sphagnum jensenii]|uniref:Uncharacterized protein n=1 Tax=Sphagnum jensenii TaxID=128206 RepID=A0ABP0WMT5_9BRYO